MSGSLVYCSTAVQAMLGTAVVESLSESVSGFRCCVCAELGNARESRTNVVIHKRPNGYTSSHLAHAGCGRSKVLDTDAPLELFAHPEDAEMYVVSMVSWAGTGAKDRRAGIVLDMTTAALCFDGPEIGFVGISMASMIGWGWQPITALDGFYPLNTECSVILHPEGTGCIKSGSGDVIVEELPDGNDEWWDLIRRRKHVDVIAGPFGLRLCGRSNRDERLEHVANKRLAVAARLTIERTPGNSD